MKKVLGCSEAILIKNLSFVFFHTLGSIESSRGSINHLKYCSILACKSFIDTRGFQAGKRAKKHKTQLNKLTYFGG